MRTIGNGTIRRIGEGVSYGTGATAKQLTDWRLATNDDNATIIAAGYFNPLAGVMQVGEFIYASVDLDGAAQGREYIVTANTGAVVTIAAVS
jgi:hypothetical protein